MTTPEDLAKAARRGRSFADLVRLHAARLPLAVFLFSGRSRPPRHLLGGVLLILGSYGLAAVRNDLHDVEIDRANARPRPLATGALSVQDARVAMSVCAVGVLGAQLLLVQPLGLLVSAVAVILGLAYSVAPVALQCRGIVGTASLAVDYLALPVILGRDDLDVRRAAVLIAGGTATLLYKDVKDEAGDRALGKRTPLVRWGARTMDLVAACLGAAALLGAAIWVGVGWWMGASIAGLLAQLVMMRTGNRAGRLLWAHRILASAGLVGVAGA